MGQKVHPIGFRLGVYRNWDARWYADKEYTKLLHEDIAIRKLINGRLRNAGVARIEIERSANQVTVIIQTAKPGIVIGKQGSAVDALREELEKISGKKVKITISEIKTADLDAKLVAENVAAQLEKRIAFRRAIKQSLMRTMRSGAQGVKIAVSGRLGGAEMSRREWDREGRVPLHTLRANIDYGQAVARTNFGSVGVTCWIYKGDYISATGEKVNPGSIKGRISTDDEESTDETAVIVEGPITPAASSVAEVDDEGETASSLEEEIPIIDPEVAELAKAAGVEVAGDDEALTPKKKVSAKNPATSTRKPAAKAKKKKTADKAVEEIEDIADEDEE